MKEVTQLFQGLLSLVFEAGLVSQVFEVLVYWDLA
jgi:hypothetical protein